MDAKVRVLWKQLVELLSEISLQTSDGSCILQRIHASRSAAVRLSRTRARSWLDDHTIPGGAATQKGRTCATRTSFNRSWTQGGADAAFHRSAESRTI